MVKIFTTKRRRHLSQTYGVNDAYLYQCLTGRRDMGPAEAMRLETESNKEVLREMLCQNTYAQIWPELATKKRRSFNAA